MTGLTVRRLRVDLDTPLPRHWAGDAFRTAFFNALSMSFPAGEQLFIDSVRRGLANTWEQRIVSRRPLLEGMDTRNWLAVTAATEHLTAVLSEHLLTQTFIVDALRQTLRNLWHDGTWWRPGTWADGARFLVGRHGLIRCTRAPGRHDLREDFHPQQGDGAVAERWLAQNAALALPVRLAA